MLEGSNGEEFIELYNSSNEKIYLENYYLAYYSSGRDWPNPYRNKKFPAASEIKANGYYLIVIKTGDFPDITPDWNLGYSSYQLSNSSGSLAIFPDNLFSENNALDAVFWGKVDFVKKGSELIIPEAGKSLERDSNGWHTCCKASGLSDDSSDLATPGKENSQKSDCPVSEEKTGTGIKIKKDDEIYKNIYADFEVNYAGATENTKYTWDFGDGHKSYLQKTRHKYEKSGTYAASITIRGDKKDFQSFKVTVDEYSAPKIKIVRIMPNPKGLDKNEWIEIKNKSKEKINLKGWSVATGWKSLVNHPIREDFILKPGKTKKLTKKICAFTLNNAQTKIELRYPDGQTAQKLKYNRKKDKISDDETFELNGKNWLWNKPQTDADDAQNNPENETVNEQTDPEIHPESNSGEIKEDIEIKIDELEMKENLGKFSENGGFAAKRQNRIQLVGYATKINTPEFALGSPGKVAGAYTEKIIRLEEKHWVFQITDAAWTQINSKINKILNKI